MSTNPLENVWITVPLKLSCGCEIKGCGSQDWAVGTKIYCDEHGLVAITQVTNPPAPLEVQHCIMDMAELTNGIRDRLQRNIDEIKASTRKLTPVEEARFEVGYGLLKDLLIDLDNIKKSWEGGHGAYRITEKILDHEE